MKKILTLIILSILFTSASTQGETYIIPNPQGLMMGARQISLGGTPTLLGDISGVMINPAVIGDIEELTFSASSQRIMDEFDYLNLHFGHTINFNINRDNIKTNIPIGFALSLGSVWLNDIPETIEYYGFPEQIDSYSAGYNIVEGSIGTTLYEQLNFDIINLGAGLKILSNYVDSSSTGTFGVDIGAIGTYNTKYEYLSRIELGLALQNIISPAMTFSQTGNDSLLPLTIYMGAKADIINDTTHLFLSSFEKGLSLGIEGEIQNNMTLRASTVFDNNQFDEFNAGAGIIFDNINLIPPFYKVSFRLDFNYTQHVFPMDNDPSYVISLTSLGRSAPKSPTILYPNADMIITPKKETAINGIGPKNSSIRVYINDQFFRTTLTNKYGQWKINDLKLKEGENKIYIQSFDMLQDFSAKSNEIYIISDTKKPEIAINIFPDNNNLLKIEVLTDEKLSDLSVKIEGTEIDLKETKTLKERTEKEKIHKTIYRKSIYSGFLSFPNELKSGNIIPKEQYNIEIKAKDIAGNDYYSRDQNFFASVSFPEDKHVHYNETLLVIGNSSNTVQNIFINDEAITADKSNKFALSIPLNPGKNLVKMTIETKNEEYLDYFMRVLRLITYPDLNSKIKGRREIEFLSTLGIIVGDDDGNFYPRRSVTRQYITKLIVNSLDTELPVVENDLYVDVPSNHPYAAYIQVAVENGLVFAFPDGSFRPEQELTLNEAIELLSSAGIIEFEEVEEVDEFVTRAGLAEFLNYTPKFEKRINRLTNFESGYNP